jgi:hypothetical protein
MTAHTTPLITDQNQITEQVALSEVDKVKTAFLAEIEEKGIVHCFEWMSIWFDRVAHAQVSDEVNNYLGEHSNDPVARGLHLVSLVSNIAGNITNQSSNESHNMFKRSRLSAMAKMFANNHNGFGSRNDLSRQWASWSLSEAQKVTPSEVIKAI